MARMFQYREIRKQEIPSYRQLVNYSFNMEAGYREYGIDDEVGEVIGQRRGLFQDDRLLCCYMLYCFHCRVRDSWFKVGALGDVASPPEHRRMGLVGKMLTGSLAEMKEREMALSALWPFSYPFYRKYGWEQATAFQSYTLEPGSLAFTSEDKLGQFRQVTATDYQLLNEIYSDFYSGYSLEIERTEEWWQDRVFRRRDTRFGYLWEAEGKARGYIIYSAKPGKEGRFWERQLLVPELVAGDHQAYLQLLRFLYYHDSQVKEVRFYAPLDDRLSITLPDPRIKQYQYEPGVMFRIVDVVALLTKLNYPAGLQGKLTLKVRDSQACWNNGQFELEVEDRQGICRRVGEDGAAGLELDINQLAPLVTGFYDPHVAAELGYIKVRERKELELLAELLPAERGYFAEFF
ncbi:MAG: GNAT family N-acetyltransferase [Halanaerobium sp.]|nr:GNAT family N-acetyltransferase [Halanaerobium sp.]